MTPEQILSHPPRVLTQAQRESYFEKGYVLVENVVPNEWIERLRDVTNEFVERSRQITESDAVWDLEPDHTADSPRLRRLTSPVVQHPAYWEFASESILADVAADIVGPDVKFHHSKLNFKWAKGGEEVKWHQDVQFWPHTNYSPATIGTLLYDCGPDQGPLGGLPGSHNGPLFDMYDEDDSWNGSLSDADAATLDLDQVEYMTGPAGSLTITTAARCMDRRQPVGCRASAAAPRLLVGGRVPVYLQSNYVELLRHDRARQAGALCAPRSAPVPDSAGLVRGLSIPLRVAARRRRRPVSWHVGHRSRCKSRRNSVVRRLRPSWR